MEVLSWFVGGLILRAGSRNCKNGIEALNKGALTDLYGGCRRRRRGGHGCLQRSSQNDKSGGPTTIFSRLLLPRSACGSRDHIIRFCAVRCSERRRRTISFNAKLHFEKSSPGAVINGRLSTSYKNDTSH